MKRSVVTLATLILLAFLSSTAQAQEPEPTHFLYFPVISNPSPWPYDVRPWDFVLQPADVPGYELDEEESEDGRIGEGSCGEGAMGSYRVYSNTSLLFSGTPVVGNVTAVFLTPQDAQGYVQCTRDYAAGHPDFSRFISLSRMGDETLAYEFVFDDGTLPATGYAIAVRKGNLITHVATVAISPWADFGVTVNFTRKAYARLEDTVASLNIEGTEMPGESQEINIQLELMRELLKGQ
jgi:hypothetical protein